MSTKPATTPKVSIVIPVYNSEVHLQKCLDSVYAQSFQEYEIIAINDGSTDSSAAILKENAGMHHNIVVLHQANHGQGHARNRALEQARGKYVLFIDADDYIDPDLLEITIARAEKDESDVVNFNWRLLAIEGDKEQIKEFNKEVFADKPQLIGADCERFLEKHNYFCWDGLYHKAFLDKHNIRFGEGYIYEDNEFIVGVASYASTISIIPRVLYTVRHGAGSSTRSQQDTSRHYRDFMRAMQKSFEVLKPRSPHTSFYLAAYCLEKFIIYYQQRVPRRYLGSYLHDFVDILHEQTLVAPAGSRYRFLRSCIRRRVFENQRYRLFYFGVQHKTKVLPLRNRLRARQS